MSDTLPPGRASDTQRLPVEALRMIRRASMEGIDIVSCMQCVSTGYVRADDLEDEICNTCGGVGYHPAPEVA